MNEDGTVGVVTAATENGSGAVAMGVAQIAAEELTVPVESVVVSMPDTDVAPYDAGSQGSRTTHIVGRAVGAAAEVLRERIYEARRSPARSRSRGPGARGRRRERQGLARWHT